MTTEPASAHAAGDGQLSVDAVLTLLQAAAADRPADDLDQVLRQEGLDGGRREEIVRVVRRIQGSYAHLQRRTQELAALFSTARELVQLHDVDTVLQRLVERAHDLIGTDVTYLSETTDASGGMAVRHSVGTVSEPFRNLFVPAGKGLASKVVEARAPVWVSRYVDMSEAPRDPGIDAAVAAEGLVSFLGVPLVVGDEVLGALFACNRFSHDFTPDQIILLSAFADHAASVLNSARLLRRSHEAAERAEQAYAELEDHVASVERASVVHERLTSVVVSGGGIADVAAALAGALERPVVVLDARLRHLAGHPAERPATPIGPSLGDAIARSRRTGRCVDLDDTGAWTVVALTGTESLLGAIAASAGAETFGPVERRMLERAAHIASLLSLQRDAVEAAAAERHSRVLSALLDGSDPHAADPTGELRTLAGEIGSAAVVQVPDGESATLLHHVVDLVGQDGIFTFRGRHLVVAWVGEDPHARTETLRESLEALLRRPVVAVTAPAPTSPSDLARAVATAQNALSVLPSLDVSGVTVSADAYAPYVGLFSDEPGAAARFVDAMLGPVIDWDSRRHTDLVRTLAAYFAHGESGSAAARVLHVHKNTVQQRLERVVTLTDGRWSDAEFRFRLHAAVRLHGLRGSAVREP
ncbi:hypothetical protein BHE97_02490 [Aeromicrobium sp. PE09-221]|uniref:helix-turn-helix domain-containing protein n=1 Tax=Aeromicrobium sp. PE09-221 TaxID=1898043 RepID=UPI000B697B37|nr:helix-turn-helix domain-containing protein [Aeromicrobium sp. PE09-221]OUZ12313.1 hypothetical protein BHE97_02490 [Aeromicrobium sp. PE09-221]